MSEKTKEISDMQYNPAFASVFKDEEQDKKEFEAWYAEVFQKLPLENRLAISGEEAVYETKKICRAFGVSDWQKVGHVSRIIRDWFVGKLDKESVEKTAIEKIGLTQEKTDNFIDMVKRSLRIIKESGQAEYNKTIEKIKLEEALDKYQDLKEMIITEASIKAEDVDYLLPGSVENWLSDYFQTIGGQKHSNFERNQYFLNSENIKKTNSKEKERLSIIFNVYDEEGFVAVDKDGRLINFEETRRVNPAIFNLEDMMNFYDGKESAAVEPRQESKKIANFPRNNQGGRGDFGNIKKIDSRPIFKTDNKEKTKKESRGTHNKNSQEKNSSSSPEEIKKTNKGFNVIDLKDYS